MIIFIVGQFIAETDRGNVWDFQGVFDSKEKAESACIDNSYFVAQHEMNKELPKKTYYWPNIYYPKAQ